MIPASRGFAYLILVMVVPAVLSQDLDWDQMREIAPRHYVAYRAPMPVIVDGRLDDDAWSSAQWSEAFVDIRGEGHPAPPYETRMKITWDEIYLYVAARLVEPHVWGTLTEKNSIIYRDNDFEVFIDPDGDRHNYYEFEINPLNTIMELTMNRPYSDGGEYELGTNISGLRSAVYVEGTLNAPHDEDVAWTLEVAIPWEGLARYAPSPLPPSDGRQWRINFSRVQWQHRVEDNVYVKVPDTPEDNWVWSPTGIVDMHRPERWGYVQFSAAAPGTDAFRFDPTHDARDVLMEVYHRQRKHVREHGAPASSLTELGFGRQDERLRGFTPSLSSVGGSNFVVSVSAADSQREPVRIAIDQHGRIHHDISASREQP